MNLDIQNATAWSEAIFGQVELGDKRLTKRLVQMGQKLSENTGSSLSKSCGGDDALLEGSYRFLRNDKISAKHIASGGYDVTGAIAQRHGLLLAIEDTTSVVYRHEVSKELGYTSNKVDAKSRGYLVHSTILMDANTEKTIGLIAQERWCRQRDEYGKRANRVTRPYKEKESYKWEKNSREVATRLGSKQQDTISVCDRDADVYEYIQYKLRTCQRFIIRATHNRKLSGFNKLFDTLKDKAVLGSYVITIPQKGNRKKRDVVIDLRATSVQIPPPKRRNGEKGNLSTIELNAIYVTERDSDEKEPLEWFLLTTESISSFNEARKVTRYYELRWRIEDFHKAWKSGSGVEKLRMQSTENIEKMMVILSFVAIRLLQLKEYFEEGNTKEAKPKEISCDELLSPIECKLLWNAIEKAPFPNKPPTAAWAFQAIAKLGGWSNSKRTGKASWATIWDGWFKLNEQVKGFLLAQKLMSAGGLDL